MTTEVVTTGIGQTLSSEMKFNGNVARVTSVVVVANPVAGSEQPQGFTREAFESALDKVSGPTGRGKLAHLRPTSEKFASRKQEEIELEERSR